MHGHGQETCARVFFSAHGTVEKWLLPSKKSWGSDTWGSGEAAGHGLVDMKRWTMVPCCVPGSGEVDGNACSSGDKAVGSGKGMVR